VEDSGEIHSLLNLFQWKEPPARIGKRAESVKESVWKRRRKNNFWHLRETNPRHPSRSQLFYWSSYPEPRLTRRAVKVRQFCWPLKEVYTLYIATWPPKSGIVKTEETSTAGQRIGKHLHAGTSSWLITRCGATKAHSRGYENERCLLENMRGLNLTVVKLTTVQVTKLQL
jgi:hypothetical protein